MNAAMRSALAVYLSELTYAYRLQIPSQAYRSRYSGPYAVPGAQSQEALTAGPAVRYGEIKNLARALGGTNIPIAETHELIDQYFDHGPLALSLAIKSYISSGYENYRSLSERVFALYCEDARELFDGQDDIFPETQEGVDQAMGALIVWMQREKPNEVSSG